MVVMHVWYFGLRGHSGEIAGKIYARPHLFLVVWVFFLCSRNSSFWWGGTPFLWFGRARDPGPGAVHRTPLWPASWLPVLDKSRGSNSAKVQRVWGIYDDRLQFVTRDDALGLDEASEHGDVSHAWSIWSSAAEAALADAFQFSGGPVPDRGLV